MKKINYYLILAICFLLPSYLVRFEVFGVPTTLLEILIYVSAIFSLILKFTSKDSSSTLKMTNKSSSKNILTWKIWLPIVLFIIAGIISIVISPDKRVALGQFKGFILDPILFFWVIFANIKNEKEINSMLYSFVASGIYVSIFAIWQKFSSQLTADNRIVGLFGYSPNYLAFYMVPLTLVLLFLFYPKTSSGVSKNIKLHFEGNKKIWLNILSVFLFFIYVYVIYLTSSRAGLISLLGAIVGGIIIKNIVLSKIKKSLKYFIVIFLIILTLVVGYKYLKPDFSLSPELGGRITSSNNIRWQIWDTTITKIIPLDSNWVWGLGLGNYQSYFSNLTSDWVNYPEWISPWALTPHNLFLHTLLNIGILGLVAFIWIIYIFFKNINFKSLASFAVFTAMLAIMTQGLIDTPYWKNDLSAMFFMFLAIVLIIKHINKKNETIS